MLLAKANARATMGSCCLLAQTIVVVAPAVQVMQVQVTVGCKQWQAVARKRNGNGRRNLACRQTQWWPRQIDNESGASVAEVNKP